VGNARRTARNPLQGHRRYGDIGQRTGEGGQKSSTKLARSCLPDVKVLGPFLKGGKQIPRQRRTFIQPLEIGGKQTLNLPSNPGGTLKKTRARED